jgi:hypothetical protein
MTGANLLNVMAFGISVAALVVAVLSTYRQLRMAHLTNQLPVMVELFREYRTYQFLTKEEALWKELPSIDPKVGFSGLPPSIRGTAYEVCNYYQTLSYLASLRITDNGMAILPTHCRVMKTWDAVEPFILQERVLRDDPLAFFNIFEMFVLKVRGTDINKEVARVRRGLHGKAGESPK